MKGEAFDIFNVKLRIQGAKAPSSPQWPYYAGVIHESNKKYKEAIGYYMKAMDIDANSMLAQRIAACYALMYRYDEALEWIDKALTLSPDDLTYKFTRAFTLVAAGDFDTGILALDTLIEEYPDYSPLYDVRGSARALNGDNEEALDDFSTALVLDPSDSESRYLLGVTQKAMGDTYGANATFEALLSLDSIPERPFILAQLGKAEEAIALTDSIIAAEPTDEGRYYNAACVYALLGDKEKALEMLKTALEKGYYSFAIIEHDSDLASIRHTDTFRNLIDEYRRKQAADIARERGTTEYVEETVSVPVTRENGVYKVRCTINDLPLHFIFDTGAGSVSMSQVEANFMLKNGYLTPADIVGSQQYMDANGNISEGTVVNLRRVNFGGLELTNVKASVVRNQQAPLLLGQSVLSRLGKIEIDNATQQLQITHKTTK